MNSSEVETQPNSTADACCLGAAGTLQRYKNSLHYVSIQIFVELYSHCRYKSKPQVHGIHYHALLEFGRDVRPGNKERAVAETIKV